MKIKRCMIEILTLNMTLSQINTIVPLATANLKPDSTEVINIETKPQVDSSTYESELKDDGNLPYSNEVFNQLYSCEKILYEYLEDKDLSLLKKCIDTFSSVTTLLDPEDDIDLYEDHNFYSIFYRIRDEIYKITDYDTQSSLITYYGEKIFTGWRKNKSVTLFRDMFLKVELIDYNKDKNQKAQPRLDYLEKIYIYFMANPDLDSNSDEIPDKNNYPPNKEDTLPPSTDNDNEGEDEEDTLPPSTDNDNKTDVSTSTESFEEYIKKNNSCIKRITYYKNGVPISTREYPVTKNNYVKCGIYTYVHSNTKSKQTTIDKDYINSNQNEESEFTIYFTINKSSKNPYYYDTGIRTSPLDNSVTYNQLKDALYQLSIKSDGFSVVENDKFLAVVEGRPIVLKKSKTTYSKLEVERLLNSFVNVGFKISKQIDNTSSSLKNYLSSKKIDSFLFKGEAIKLSSPFILVEEQLYGPIQEIVTHLGAKADLKDKTLTITNDTTNIELSINSKSYKFNKKEMLFESSPIIYNSSIYSIVDVIISELGYEISWDSDSGELNIYKK